MRAGSGRTSCGPFAFYDRELCSWRMLQVTLASDSEPYSGSFPSAGSMRSGLCSRRPPWAPRTSASGCSSWPGLPTPRASDGAKGLYPLSRPENGDNLATRLARLLPTPTASPYGSNQSDSPGASNRPSLGTLAPVLLPTPRASANENRQTKVTPSQASGKHGRSLAAEVCCLPPEPATATRADPTSEAAAETRRCPPPSSRNAGAATHPLSPVMSG